MDFPDHGQAIPDDEIIPAPDPIFEDLDQTIIDSGIQNAGSAMNLFVLKVDQATWLKNMKPYMDPYAYRVYEQAWLEIESWPTKVVSSGEIHASEFGGRQLFVRFVTDRNPIIVHQHWDEESETWLIDRFEVVR